MPRPKGGGHPSSRYASPARLPGTAALIRAGDYVWVDPDEPAADGRLAAVRDPARGGQTVVRLLVERDGRRSLRALDGRFPERTFDAGNETGIRGVVVLVGNTV